MALFLLDSIPDSLRCPGQVRLHLVIKALGKHCKKRVSGSELNSEKRRVCCLCSVPSQSRSCGHWIITFYQEVVLIWSESWCAINEVPIQRELHLGKASVEEEVLVNILLRPNSACRYIHVSPLNSAKSGPSCLAQLRARIGPFGFWAHADWWEVKPTYHVSVINVDLKSASI